MSANIYNVDGTKRPAPDADRIRLGQRIEAAEARTGEPSPQRLLAERAVEVIRSGPTSITDMRDRADKADCTIVIEETIVDGKIRYSGFIKAGDGTGLKVKLSALPPDCRAGAIMRRFDEGKPAEAKPMMTANQAKYHARAAFQAAEAADPTTLDAFLADASRRLAEKGMSIERQGKTGAYIRYAEGDQGKIKLSDLGGRYSLHAFNKKYNGKITANASFVHGNQEKVNGFSVKSLASSANDRATTADERAAAIAAEGVQARTLAEALDDADAQAVALDAARRAHAAAARAEARAEQAEARLDKAEKEKNAMELKPEPKPTMTHEKATAEQSTAVEGEAVKKENPTSDIPQEKALKIDISLDLCDPPVPGTTADNPAQDTPTGPRLR